MFFFQRKKLFQSSDFRMPSHIAIIMDGNARWAKSKKLPLFVGHKIGSENLRKIAECCVDLGIKYLTVYAFSSENWNRPQDEVNHLMKLLDEYLKNEVTSLMKNGVKIVVSGDLKKYHNLQNQESSKFRI